MQYVGTGEINIPMWQQKFHHNRFWPLWGHTALAGKKTTLPN
jgi:hypothetical protein